MGMTPHGSPYSAATRFASRLAPSCPSGSTAHCIELTMGPCPQLVGAPGDDRRHLDQVAHGHLARCVVTVWKCFVVLLKTASASCSALVAGGTSVLVTTGPQ